MNLPGTSITPSNASTAPPPSSPFSKIKPPTPLSIARNCHTPLVPTPIDTDSQPSSLLMNGNGAGENVTVTHYSEERGTMEKISVPPLNLFNVDVAPDQAADQQRSTNPFLNMSPTANSTPVVTTNPFRSPNDSDKPAAAAVKSTNGTLSTNHTTSKIPVPISLNSSNGNGNHIIEPVTPVATNPFTTLSEIDGGAKVIAMNRQNSIKRTNSKLKYANNNSVSYANSKNNNGKSNEDGIIASEVS